MTIRILSWILMLWGNSAFASSAADFFCAPISNRTPLYFDRNMKSCESGALKDVGGICVEQVSCVFLTQEMKDAAKKETGKTFESLTELEKNRLRNRLKWDPLPAELTCPGEKTKIRTTRGGREVFSYLCPQPSACKGDSLFFPKAAAYAGSEPLGLDTFQVYPGAPSDAVPTGVAK